MLANGKLNDMHKSRTSLRQRTIGGYSGLRMQLTLEETRNLNGTLVKKPLGKL
jgi:hypothetical protein